MLGRVRLAAVFAALLLAPAAQAGDSWWRDAVGAGGLALPGPGVPITVIDTGVDLSHPSFADRPGATALNVQTVHGAREGHGTAVASVIGLGLYPQARLLSWYASPSGFFTNGGIASGLEAAAAPGVANLSLGGRSWNRAEADAVAAAYGRGIVTVAAAGNDGERDSAASFPADLPHVLTVGSVGRDGQPSAFTTHSRAIDVAAPGEDVLTAVPPDGYATARGTSVATPFVSASLAWIWTQRPELDHTQLVELVRRTARDVGPPGRDDQTGFGVIDVGAALAAPAPIPDPLEPNDDVRWAMTPAPASLAARIDSVEDVDDVYRVQLAMGAPLGVELRSHHALGLELWDADTPTIRATGDVRMAHLLASGRGVSRRQVAVTMNHGRSPATIFVRVRLRPGVERASYALWLNGAAPS